jgi:hypothetical protein
MADRLLTPRWYLQQGAWPYWLPDALAAFAAPGNNVSIQTSPWPDSNGGILGGLTQASAASRPPARGGILGPLTASSDNQSTSIPDWLQSAGLFGLSPVAALPPTALSQAATWSSSPLSKLSELPASLSDSTTLSDSTSPYWLRTTLRPDANSESFRPPHQPVEQPPNPTPQWPAATGEESRPASATALLPGGAICHPCQARRTAA